jgi:Uma2 family endonuclease
MVQPLSLIHYPDTDGQPMTESDPTRDYLTYGVEALRLFFRSRRNIYVSGNLFIYYEEGSNQKSISPDVFVIFGVSKRKRRSYKTWQEGNRLPAFVLELTSFSTRKQDEESKPQLYEQLGIQEYFQFDPTGDYLNPPLKGRRLVNGQYQAMALTPLADGNSRLYSETLGLELRLEVPQTELRSLGPSASTWDLRFYDPVTGMRLLNFEETEQAREKAEQERDAAEQERDAAEQERDAAEQERDTVQQEREAAVPRLLAMGLSLEQVAGALNLTLEDVQRLAN